MAEAGIRSRYTRTAIALHWAIAALILVNLPVGFFHEEIEAALGASPMPLHKSTGLTVLLLSLARLAWRWAHPPPFANALTTLERRAAATVHALFYVAMIGLPLTGWLVTSAGKYPLTWFGLVDVPKFAVDKGSAVHAGNVLAHEIGGWILFALVVLHVGAALRHAWFGHDVIGRMLPVVFTRAASRPGGHTVSTMKNSRGSVLDARFAASPSRASGSPS